MSSNKSSGLYPKQAKKKRHSAKSAYNNNDLLLKYQNQKKAEADFYNLQTHKKYVEDLIMMNPRLIQFYSTWLTRANEALKEYTNIIDQPDNLSFSVFFINLKFLLSFVLFYVFLSRFMDILKMKKSYLFIGIRY